MKRINRMEWRVGVVVMETLVLVNLPKGAVAARWDARGILERVE